MSYEVLVRHTSDSGDGISVEARVEGEPVAHTFPKGLGYFDEPDGNGRPAFIEKLEEKYEEKMKREGRVSIQETSTEEAKIHGKHFENTTYGGSENFKEEDNQKNVMANIDLDKPEEIRSYLKENMAEGYLSENEGLNIDRFVDRYKTLLKLEDQVDEVVKDAVGVEQ